MLSTEGGYSAKRAAALAGIPVSTLYYWARQEIWIPKVPQTKFMRWSYADLYALRLIDWLRQDKPDVQISPTPMAKIRLALGAVEDMGEKLKEGGVLVWVDNGGRLVLKVEDETFVPLPAGLVQGVVGIGPVNLVEATHTKSGLEAPNLVVPRPTLRIFPGKLASEPHVIDTRIPTQMLARLSRRGFSPPRILELYPRLELQNIEEAISLEEQLDANLRPIAA